MDRRCCAADFGIYGRIVCLERVIVVELNSVDRKVSLIAGEINGSPVALVAFDTWNG